MASYTIITATQKQAFEEAFVSYVNSMADLKDAFGVPTAPIYGFQITADEFLGLVSIIGVDQWKIRFGYDGTHFMMMVEGADNTGQGMTPIYQLTEHIHQSVDPSLLTGTNGVQYGGKVPDVLVTNWLTAWNNLVSEQQIPQSFFQTSYGVLKGYNFTSQDFLDVLTEPGNENTSSIHILFINHAVAQAPTGGGSQYSSPGYFGLMLSSMNDDTPPAYNNTFYDFSAPCPPTCL